MFSRLFRYVMYFVTNIGAAFGYNRKNNLWFMPQWLNWQRGRFVSVSMAV